MAKNTGTGIGFTPRFCKKCGRLMYPTPHDASCPRCGYKEPVDLSRAQVDQSVKGDHIDHLVVIKISNNAYLAIYWMRWG